VHVLAESDLNDPRLVRSPERGGHGLDAQWSDDFHHAVHVALTGERDGYYADFGGVGPIAKSLRDRFVHDGVPSAYRRRRHGAPAADVPADRFVVFVQNHDQVGNRVRGDRLAALVPLARQKLAAALLLLSPYVPLLFMGEEYGETNPFLYFVSHGDRELIAAVREGRRREFAEFGWTGDVPDPQAVGTFLRSRLDRTRANPALLALYRDCLRLRREEPALRPGDAESTVSADVEAGWVTLRLAPAAGACVVAVFSLADAQDVPLPGPRGKAWDVLLSTDGERYAGAGGEAAVRSDGDRPRVAVPAWSAVLLREVST